MKFSMKRFVNQGYLFFTQNIKTLLAYFGLYTIGLILVYTFIAGVASGIALPEQTTALPPAFFYAMDFMVVIISWVTLYAVLQHILKRRYHNTNITISYFLTPSSAFEKWLFDIFVIVLGFTLTNLGLMYLISKGVTYSFSQYADNDSIGVIFQDSKTLLATILIMTIGLSLQVVDFMKNDSKKWKWQAVGGITFFILFPISWLLDYLFFGNTYNAQNPFTRMPLQGLNIPNSFEKHENYGITSPWALDDISIYFLIPCIIFIWAIHFFKIKEFEI